MSLHTVMAEARHAPRMTWPAWHASNAHRTACHGRKLPVHGMARLRNNAARIVHAQQPALLRLAPSNMLPGTAAHRPVGTEGSTTTNLQQVSPQVGGVRALRGIPLHIVAHAVAAVVAPAHPCLRAAMEGRGSERQWQWQWQWHASAPVQYLRLVWCFVIAV